MQDEKKNMEDFHDGVHNGIQNIKGQMNEMRENLEQGEIHADKLHEGVKDNLDENKIANSKVKKAAEAIRRNKDGVFLGITVLTTVGLILVFILL